MNMCWWRVVLLPNTGIIPIPGHIPGHMTGNTGSSASIPGMGRVVSAGTRKDLAKRVSLLTHLTYLTLTMYPFQPTPPPNHRFDDDDGGFDPDRLAHYDALTCRVVSVQRSRVMS